MERPQPNDIYSAIMAKLLTLERTIADMREELAELREEVSELRTRDGESWSGGTD
jgi:wobble nucleotide-excising tRNase